MCEGKCKSINHPSLLCHCHSCVNLSGQGNCHSCVIVTLVSICPGKAIVTLASSSLLCQFVRARQLSLLCHCHSCVNFGRARHRERRSNGTIATPCRGCLIRWLQMIKCLPNSLKYIYTFPFMLLGPTTAARSFQFFVCKIAHTNIYCSATHLNCTVPSFGCHRQRSRAPLTL